MGSVKNIVALVGQWMLPDFKKRLRGFVRRFELVNRPANALKDMLAVLGHLYLFVALAILALVFFCVLPQGKDILYVVAEDGFAHRWDSLLFLLAGLVFWGCMAEFAVAYRLKAVDNTGLYLTHDRVVWRIYLQRLYSKLFLFLPLWIVGLGFVLSAATWSPNFGAAFHNMLSPLAVLCGAFFVLYHLYVQRSLRRRAKPLSEEDQAQIKIENMLNGIYKPTVVRALRSTVVEKLGEGVLTPPKKGEDWPQALKNYPNQENLSFAAPPKEAKLVAIYPPKGEDAFVRWEFRVPPTFFKRLHGRLLWAVGMGLAVLVTVSLLPGWMYDRIGAVALVAFAFGAWLGLGSALTFLERAKAFPKPFTVFNHIPYKVCLLLLLLYSSVANNDHPVRYLGEGGFAAGRARPELHDHFNSWFDAHAPASLKQLAAENMATEAGHCCDKKDSLLPDFNRLNVVFVCAEGGALRTGAMAATLLAGIQYHYPQFKNHIYGYSTVSGGSVGVGLFQAINQHPTQAVDQRKLVSEWFGHDFIAAVVAKLFYSEVIQLFIPFHVPGFDRAIALEQAWEKAYHYVPNGRTEPNLMEADFLKMNASDTPRPAWFINTTEVETGYQAWITNVRPDLHFAFRDCRDLYPNLFGNLRLSTAINFSTRFPLISPAATVGGYSKRHFVDGGYVENTGAATMLELLRSLSSNERFVKYCRPHLLMVRFGEEDELTRQKPLSFGNEWREIVSGFMKVRSGNADFARRNLFLHMHNWRDKRSPGCYRFNPCLLADSVQRLSAFNEVRTLPTPLDTADFEANFNVSTAKVPMNWLLSQKSMSEVNKYCDSIVGSLPFRAFMKDMRIDEKKP